MPTSSAKPARLLRYRNQGLGQVEEWEPEVGHLRTALSDLRSALSSLDLPDNCQVPSISMFYENWYESLTQAQRHLDEWVGDVGNGFLEAEGINPAQYDIDAHLNDSMTVDDGEIQVGFADMFESEAQAREDARALQDILGDYGIIHPYELANNPELLEEMAQQYPELRDILARSARFADDESYAAELVNTLGPQDVRTMADLTNTFGMAQDRGMIDDDAYLGYVVPFAAILGNADRSGRMDDSVRDAIFDMDATDEEPIDGTSVDYIQEGALEDMRHRTLALLLTGDFSPQTTAEMANVLLDDPSAPTTYGVAGEMQGFTNPLFLENHQALASDQYAALVALQGDEAAANAYYSMDENGDGQFENLYTMGHDGGLDVAADRLEGLMSREDLESRIDQTIANGLQGGILEQPMSRGADGLYSQQQFDLVSQMIQVAGDEYMDTSAPVRQSLAQISAPYTQDIAIVAAGGGDDLPDNRLPGLNQDHVGAFFEEVSESEEGRVALSQNAAAMVRHQVDGQAMQIYEGHDSAMGTAERLSSAYYSELGTSWDNVQIGWVEQREALVAGWQTVTDPLVDVVSGKIVERIPGANAPVVGDLIDSTTGTIADSINDAVYGHFIPEPELESMQTWDDAVGNDVRTSVAKGLYGNEEVRDLYLNDLKQDDRELWDQIHADGEVSLEEFRDIEAVRNAVNEYGGEIINGYETDMVFDKVFK